MSLTVIDSLFRHNLGHLPTEATLAGFRGLTNKQAFLAMVGSDSSDTDNGVFDLYLTSHSTPLSILIAVLIIGVAIATHASIPIRHGGILASRASAWLRDHF